MACSATSVTIAFTLRIDALDLLEVSVQRFARAEFLAADQVRHFGCGEETDIRSCEAREQLRGCRRGSQHLRGLAASDQWIGR